MFEDAQFMAAMYNISPELTCQCDEVHTCQQCIKELNNEYEKEIKTRRV